MRFTLFAPKTTPIVGVDITSSSVRMVELAEDGAGVIRLERYAIEKLAPGMFFDGVIVKDKDEDLAASIKSCHRRLGSRVKNLAIALSPSSVVHRHITVEADLNEEGVEQQVNNDLPSLTPFNATNVNVDFQVLGSRPGQDEFKDVLVVAAERDKIEERVLMIENAGFKVVVVDSETLSVFTALQEMLERQEQGTLDQNFAIVDIGAQTMTLTVLRNGESIYAREAMFGHDQLINDLVMNLGITAEVAEAIRLGTEEAPEGYVAVLDQYQGMAALEVQRAVQLFVTSTSFTSVEGVFLSGDVVRSDGLVEVLADRLGIACQRFNPFAGLGVNPGIDLAALDRDATALVVACGLAYRRFDK